MATEQEREKAATEATWTLPTDPMLHRPGDSEAIEARNLVNGDRQAAYGSPRPAYEAMAQTWSGLLAHKLTAPLTPEDVVILLMGMKLTREARKPKRDNRVDLHGYGIVLAHVIEGANG